MRVSYSLYCDAPLQLRKCMSPPFLAILDIDIDESLHSQLCAYISHFIRPSPPRALSILDTDFSQDLVSLAGALGTTRAEQDQLIKLESSLRKELNKIKRDFGGAKAMGEEIASGTRKILAGGDVAESDVEHQKYAARQRVVQTVRSFFKDNIIRRLNTSLDNLGNKINGLPPLWKHDILVNMSDLETAGFARVVAATAQGM